MVDPVAANPLANQIRDLSIELGTRGAIQNIKTFGGNPKEFKEWIRSIEKYGNMEQADDARKKKVAYGTATGVVSDYVERYLTNPANVDAAWDVFKQDLKDKFGDIVDATHALTKLLKI